MRFWDTSAILPLVFAEPHTASATAAWNTASICYAWRWAAVEANAALVRRGGRAAQQDRLNGLLQALHLIDMGPDDAAGICGNNRRWKLRAADAGHLYCFSKAVYVVPELELVCYDDEMTGIAQREGWRVWRGSAERPGGPAVVREALADYVAGGSRPKRRRVPVGHG